MRVERRNIFIKLLKELLAQIVAGSVSISKQNGEVSYLTAEEVYLDFEQLIDYVAVENHAAATAISDKDLTAFLKYLDRVQFGIVSIKIKDAQIIGVEKRETFKVL
ncbi:MAG: DUF2292 domain-containing protein [Peptococcaceae bacterium]|jgi:hypothetical protein|nr:DUF2292 domain-containing protein [Peptococcaceae bacterium]